MRDIDIDRQPKTSYSNHAPSTFSSSSGGSTLASTAIFASVILGTGVLAKLSMPERSRFLNDSQRDTIGVMERVPEDPRDRTAPSFAANQAWRDALAASPVSAPEPEALPKIREILKSIGDLNLPFERTELVPEAPIEEIADQVITDLLTAGAGSISHDNIPVVATLLAELAGETEARERTMRKVDYILRYSHRNPEGDALGVELTAALDENRTLLRIARANSDDILGHHALLLLSRDYPLVANWLKGEQEVTLKNRIRNFLNDESNVQLFNMLEELIAKGDSDSRIIADARKQIQELQQRIEVQSAALKVASEKQSIQEAQIATMNTELAAAKANLEKMEAEAVARAKEVEELKKKLEDEHRRNHITVNGQEFRIDRWLTGTLDIREHNRNFNFRLPCHSNEKILCVIVNEDLNEGQKQAYVMRLKRDKRNAEDKDVRNPLRHGDLWQTENYDSNGERFYVKHEGNRALQLRFLVVR